ncbi:MAG: hypothetical protein ACI80S_000435 [Pseudohongiellaceae bacterium]|jgi:hypothetical protein
MMPCHDSKGVLFSKADFNVKCNGDSLAIMTKESVDVTNAIIKKVLALHN